MSDHLFSHLHDIVVPTPPIHPPLNIREAADSRCRIVPRRWWCGTVAADRCSQRLGASRRATHCHARSSSSITRTDQLNADGLSKSTSPRAAGATPQEIATHHGARHPLSKRLPDRAVFCSGILLVDFKRGIAGCSQNEMIADIVADYISPDACRLLGHQVERKLDKESLLRRVSGGVLEAYPKWQSAGYPDGERSAGWYSPLLVKT